VIDRDGAVLFAKPAAERLLGIPFSQLVGAQVGFPHTPGGAIEIEVVAGGAPRVAEMRVVVDQPSDQRQTAHAAANPRAPSQPGTFPRRWPWRALPTGPLRLDLDFRGFRGVVLAA
jgi:PAS domain-containing protein